MVEFVVPNQAVRVQFPLRAPLAVAFACFAIVKNHFLSIWCAGVFCISAHEEEVKEGCINMNSKKFAKGCGNIVSAISKWTTLVFLALRACDVINWEWYWILSPSLIAVIMGILGLALAGAASVNDNES